MTVEFEMKHYRPPKIENLLGTGIDEEFGDAEFAATQEAREDDLNLIDLSDPHPVIYFHGHHTNSCVVGEILIASDVGSEVIAITHDIVYQDYGDNLCDITKLWDSHVQVELISAGRYDTDYDRCIHIPLDMAKHTDLTNQVLKQILIDNNVKFVTLSSAYKSKLILSDFLKWCLGFNEDDEL